MVLALRRPQWFLVACKCFERGAWHLTRGVLAVSACFRGAQFATDGANPSVCSKSIHLLQVVIQLRKFAEAVRRIKTAVSPDASPGRAPPRMTGPRAVLSADVSDMLRTELSGIDPSVLGVPLLLVVGGLPNAAYAPHASEAPSERGFRR